MSKKHYAVSSSAHTICDIAIVGGGIGGLYAGTRITKEFPGKKIVILEQKKEVGGRLKSEFFEEVPEIPIEHGGMRFSNDHLLISKVISDLKLKVSPFKYDLDGYVLRGKRCPAKDREEMINGINSIYNLKKGERNKTPEELVEYAIEQITQEHNLHGKSEPEKSGIIRNLIKTDTYEGVPYYKINWAAYLFQTLSTEAINLIKATEGYNSNFDNISASEGMRELYRFKEEFYYLDNGYQSLVKTLKKKFLNTGGQLKLQCECLEFDKLSSKKENKESAIIYKKIRQANTKPHKYYLKIHNISTGIEEFVFCNQIILALPKNAIKKLNRFTEFFNPFSNGLTDVLLDKVQEMKSLKIYIQFEHSDSDPWKKKDLYNKKIFSDGAIRMFYILNKTGVPNSNSKPQKNSVGLVYIDQTSAYEMPIPNGYKSAKSILQNKHSLLTEHLSRHIQDLIRIYKDEHNFKLPKIKNIAYSFWDEAYHCFIPQVDANITIEKMIHPVDDFDVFICGSSYSSKQSWAEGALLTTEYMISKHFGITLPSDIEKYIEDNLFL
jgi:hypothetical protein